MLDNVFIWRYNAWTETSFLGNGIPPVAAWASKAHQWHGNYSLGRGLEEAMRLVGYEL